MIKGAIFDADGTLLDSMHIWEEAVVRYLKRFGLVLDPCDFDKMFKMSLEESNVYLKRQYKLKDETEKIKSDFLEIIKDFYYYEVTLKPGVYDFLQKLKEMNIPMAVATSGDKDLLTKAFKRLNIYDHFKAILTCTELNTTKRDGLIYKKAAEIINTDPCDTVVFEDVLHGIISASSAGFKTVGIKDPTSKNEEEEIIKASDYYILDFFNFDNFLKFALEN